MGEMYKKSLLNSNEVIENMMESFKKVDYDNSR